MKLPIAYAILESFQEPILEPLNLLELNSINFEKIDEVRYPIWEIKEHLLNNPDMGVVLNSANEASITKFIKGEYRFIEMVKAILKTYKKFDGTKIDSLEDIFSIDKEIREYIKSS